MVIELNKNNFDKEVFKSNGITLVVNFSFQVFIQFIDNW